MPATTRLGITYPGDTDLITNGDEAIQTICDAFDAQGLVYLIGLIAARPAASAVAGRIYIATDTGGLSVSTGSTWLDTWQPPDGAVTIAKLHADLSALIPPLGTLLDYGGATAPNTSWKLCDGAAISRSTYSALFALIGTAYGVGDGSTTFNLPDTRGRSTVGQGTHADVDARGDSDGAAVGDRRPKHSHTVVAVGGHSHGGETGDITINHAHAMGYDTVPHAGSSGYINQFGPSGSVAGQTGVDGNQHHHLLTSDGGHNHAVGTGALVDSAGYVVVQKIIRVL